MTDRNRHKGQRLNKYISTLPFLVTLENRPKLCQCDNLRKLDTFCIYTIYFKSIRNIEYNFHLIYLLAKCPSFKYLLSPDHVILESIFSMQTSISRESKQTHQQIKNQRPYILGQEASQKVVILTFCYNYSLLRQEIKQQSMHVCLLVKIILL